MSSKNISKKQKRDEEDEDVDMEAEQDERVLFWIPSEGISMDVLVFYLQKFLGYDSDAEPGRNPRDPDKDGYFIRSRLGLSTPMVRDLKTDSEEWKNERRRKRTKSSYPSSETAARRVQDGASAQPTIPQKTRDLQAQRAKSAQPQIQSMTQSANRHQVQQNPPLQPGSLPSTLYQQESSQRHQSTYAGQPTFDYGSPSAFQSRQQPNINLSVNMSAASFSQANPQRHQSSPQPNVLPSIERQYQSPAPAYEEEDPKPSQPSTTGSQGWSHYATAGSRHNR